MAFRRIGQIFVDLGFIGDEQLELILEEKEQQPDILLGQIAIDLGVITEEQLAQALAEQMGLQIVTLAEVNIPKSVLELVTEPMAQLYKVIPIQFNSKTNELTVATSEPQNLSIKDELRTLLGYDIEVVGWGGRSFADGNDACDSMNGNS